MKKSSVFPFLLAITLTLGELVSSSSVTHADAVKESLTLPGGGSYYGEVVNGKALGLGTVRWPNGKTYSGSFVDNLRWGTGKYIEEYKIPNSPSHYKIVYTGSWSKDQMNGNGTWTKKRFLDKNHMISNQIQTGTFKNNSLLTGYIVIHAEADPEYSFTYRKKDNAVLNILENEQNLIPLWKKGSLFSVFYAEGSRLYNYSIFPEDSAKKERERQASIKYLKSITSKVTPHLQKFEQLSKQLSLK